MDIYEYLKLDHDHVAKLFKQFEHAELEERKKQIADFICEELFVHALSEQDTFYKALQQFESTQEDAVHGKEEHSEIDAQIQLIINAKDFGSVWVKNVEKLKELVEHHVAEEEGPIFRHAKKVLTDEDAYIIKEQMHYLKQQMLMAIKEQKKLTNGSQQDMGGKKSPLLNKKDNVKRVDG